MSGQLGLQALASAFRDSRARGASVDEAIASLRDLAGSPIDAIKILMAEEGLTLAQAKTVVDASEGWADLAQRTCEVRNGLIDAAKSGGDEG